MIRKISAGFGLAIMTAALAACTGTPSGNSFAPNGAITAGQSHAIRAMDSSGGGGPIGSGNTDGSSGGGGPIG